jgi:hypothetical protein
MCLIGNPQNNIILVRIEQVGTREMKKKMKNFFWAFSQSLDVQLERGIGKKEPWVKKSFEYFSNIVARIAHQKEKEVMSSKVSHGKKQQGKPAWLW